MSRFGGLASREPNRCDDDVRAVETLFPAVYASAAGLARTRS